MRVETLEKLDEPVDMQYMTRMVFAMALGDGYLGVNGGTSAAMRIAHTEKHKNYVYWKANILRKLTNVTIYYRHAEPSKPHYALQTLTHPLYTTIYQKMYPLGVKTLNPDLLKLLDWPSLVIWFMDDGSLCSNGVSSYACKWHTENFSYGDNMVLSNTLSRFDLTANVRERKQNGKSYWYLRLPVKSIQTLIDGISPFVLDSYKYKLDFKR